MGKLGGRERERERDFTPAVIERGWKIGIGFC